MPPASSSVADPWDDWESEDYGRGHAVAGQSSSQPVDDEASNNARLWHIANNSLSFGPSNTQNNLHGPGGHINPYSYASSSSTSIPPPAAAFAPSLKILKRPSKNDSAAALAARNEAAKDQKKSLKDRERAYNEARNRIFGATSPSGPGNTVQASGSNSGASTPAHGHSAPQSPNPNLNPETEAPAGSSLASSIERLDLDEEKRTANSSGVDGQSGSVQNPTARPSSVSGGTRGSPLFGPGLGLRSTSSGRGKPRTASNPSGLPTDNSPSSSVPGSRSSTPINTSGSTIIREPVNPPTATAKQGSATAHAQARGFTKTKKKKMLSPAAAAFVPGGFGQRSPSSMSGESSPASALAVPSN